MKPDFAVFRAILHYIDQFPEQLRASGMWQIVTPDECVALIREHGTVALHPLMGGMPPELGWKSLELFIDKVVPQVQAKAAVAAELDIHATELGGPQ